MPNLSRDEPSAAPCEVHAVTRLCRARVADAMALLGTAAGMARWCLGMWATRERGAALYEGRSLFGGGAAFALVQTDAERGWVRYAVGGDEYHLVPRIEARVQSGAELGHAEGTCIVTLLAWRTAQMNGERWRRLAATHEVEIDLIRAALEEANAAGSGAPAKRRKAAR
jgi:hypothetical protein